MIIGAVNSFAVRPRVLPAPITLTPAGSGTTTGWTLGSGTVLALDGSGYWSISGSAAGATRSVTVEPDWAYEVAVTGLSANGVSITLDVFVGDTPGGYVTWTSNVLGVRTATTQSAFFPTGGIGSSTELKLRFTGAASNMDLRIEQIVITAYVPS